MGIRDDPLHRGPFAESIRWCVACWVVGTMVLGIGTSAASGTPVSKRERIERVIEEVHRIEAARETARQAIAEAISKGDRATAVRHAKELIALPDPPLRDCRQALGMLRWGGDRRSLAGAYEATANAMKRVMTAPPTTFIQPAPPKPPGEWRGGQTVEVQTNLDGTWQQVGGFAEHWIDFIQRMQQEVKRERFRLLCELAKIYRDDLKEPEKAIGALREGLSDLALYTMPIEEAIAEHWPVRERVPAREIELGIYTPAARDLVTLLDECGQLEAAVEMQNRVLLASLIYPGMPYREIEKLWSMLKRRPAESPLPPLVWLNVLSEDSPAITFDLDKSPAPNQASKLHELNVVARPSLEFNTLELSADMEGRGGFLGVWCSTLRDGKHASLGRVSWHRDQRKGREVRTATFQVPVGTGVIYFHRAWLPGGKPDVDVHRITVKATFRKAR